MPALGAAGRKEANVTDRWWFPFTGMEELSFKRVPDGWVYRAPNPWLLGPARYYLLNEARKSEVASRHRRAWRFTFFAIVAVVAAGVPMTASELDAQHPLAVLAAYALVGVVVGMISNAYLVRAVRPVIAGLEPTAPPITRSEAIKIQIAAFSGRHMLFLALLSAAMFAVTALPPLLGSDGWDVRSVCGAVLFGTGAAYWFALYVAKRKRSAA
ncbi:MAG TPA: hypothetical protein VH397_13670 [Xanthobacteraceae bacterium]|jgi:hypothetical protein